MRLSLDPSATHDLPFSRRLSEALALAIVLSAVYFGVGAQMTPSAHAIPSSLDGRIPFLPEAVWVYLPGYVSTFLIALWAIREARQFRATLAGLGMLTALALPFFLFYPVACPRPPLPSGNGLTLAMVRWLYTNDPNVNTFPSLHVANATFCAIATSGASRRWGAASWLLAVGVAVSVLTLKQHSVVDVPGGLAIAGVVAAAWRSQLGVGSLAGSLPRRLIRARHPRRLPASDNNPSPPIRPPAPPSPPQPQPVPPANVPFRRF